MSEEEGTGNAPSWTPLREIVLPIVQSNGSFAAVYDTIKKEGIFRLDPFGRPVSHKDDQEVQNALGLVLSLHEYDALAWEANNRGDEEPEHPLNDPWPDDVFWQFGWPGGRVPQFRENAEFGAVNKPAQTNQERPSGLTKQLKSALVVVAALIAERGLAAAAKKRDRVARVRGLLHDIGCHRDDETIRGLLKQADEVCANESGKAHI